MMCVLHLLSPGAVRLQEPSRAKRVELNGLSPAVDAACLSTLLCIWSARSLATGPRTDMQHLELPSSPTWEVLEERTRMCRLSHLRPSALHPMIPADSSRHVTAGSETKVEQRQVKPSRSHIFLKASVPFSPHRGLKNSVCLSQISGVF